MRAVAEEEEREASEGVSKAGAKNVAFQLQIVGFDIDHQPPCEP